MSKIEVKKLFNLMFNMYAFFCIVEWGKALITKEEFSVSRVLTYALFAHAVGFFMVSFVNKKEDKTKNQT